MSSNRLRAIDLFCGAGGLTEGFRDAGFEVSFALDNDLDSCETYHYNHRKTQVECESITKLSANDVKRRSGGDVDVIIGGPSCQGFSTHGRKVRWVDPKDERNALWVHMLEVVEAIKPKAFLMENVPGMLYWKDGKFGAKILKEYEELGFTVSFRILLAADYGVPQRRRRLLIVGTRGSEFQFPTETHLGGWRRDSLDLWEARRKERGLLRHLTCWEAIGDLPALKGGLGRTRAEYVSSNTSPVIELLRGKAKVLRDHEVPAMSPRHLELIKHVPPGGTWRDIPRHLLPDRYRGMRRTDSTNLLGRLAPDLPAYTITTQFTNVTTGCFTHPFEDRSLSVREGARLQTFPDTYFFKGSLDSKERQIGNAVPPVLATVLAHQLAELIEGNRRVARYRPHPLHPAKKELPPPTTSDARRRMRAQKRVDTRPEMLLRRELAKFELRYETDIRPLAGLRRTADVVFKSAKVAVFVDGCFWHGCPTHARPTKSNTKWWAEKIQANKVRDKQTTRLLKDAGWAVIRVWEHEPPASAAATILDVVTERRPRRRVRPA